MRVDAKSSFFADAVLLSISTWFSPNYLAGAGNCHSSGLLVKGRGDLGKEVEAGCNGGTL